MKIWMALHRKTADAWKIDSDLQELALFLERHGKSGRQILEGRARRSMGRRDRAHWKRLLWLLDACEFGLLRHPLLGTDGAGEGARSAGAPIA